MDILSLKGSQKIKAISELDITPQNAELFFELAKSSRGTAKELAMIGLVQLDYPPALTFWQELYKKADKGESIFVRSSIDDIARLVAPDIAKLFKALSDKPTGDTMSHDEYDEFHRAIALMLGKSSDEILDIYRFVGEHLTKFSKLKSKNTFGTIDFFTFAINKPKEQAKIFPILLAKSIIVNPCDKLINLAHELYQKHNGVWLIAVFVSALLTQSAKDVFDNYAHYLDDKHNEYIYNGLGLVFFDNKTEKYHISCDICRHTDVDKMTVQYKDVPIFENLDERWYLKLITPINPNTKIILQSYATMGVLYHHYDQMLGELLPQSFNNKAIEKAIIEYFKSRQEQHNGSSTLYMDIYKQLNIAIDEHMFLKYVLCKDNAINIYSLESNARKYMNWDKKQIKKFADHYLKTV